MLDEAEIRAALHAALDAIARAPGVRYAEARFQRDKTERLRVRDGRPEQATRGGSMGIAVRVLGRDTWGFACTPRVDDAGAVDAAKRALAVAVASGAPLARAVNFPARPASRGSYATPLAIDPFTIPVEEKLRTIDRPVRALLAKGKPIQSAEAWTDWTRLDKLLLTTEGTDVAQSFTYGTLGMHVVAVGDDGNAQKRSYPAPQGSDGFQGGWERAREVDLDAHVDRIADEASALLQAPPCPAGARDLILSSDQVALQIHESCGHPTELDRALGAEISLAGGSFMQPAMLGKLVYGDPRVTIVADATSPGGMGTFGWDDEGVPAGRHPLVERGMFVDYLSNRETAAALGRASTGTMRADGWNRPPLIRMVNVSLEPGPDGATLDALVGDTDDGVLMAIDKSWSIDDLRLNFQFSCEIGWEIKRGKKTRIVRDPVYTGITPEFWRGCNAICGKDEWRLWGFTNCGKGDPMQLMQVGHGAAPARFSRVTIGSSASGRSA